MKRKEPCAPLAAGNNNKPILATPPLEREKRRLPLFRGSCQFACKNSLIGGFKLFGDTDIREVERDRGGPCSRGRRQKQGSQGQVRLSGEESARKNPVDFIFKIKGLPEVFSGELSAPRQWYPFDPFLPSPEFLSLFGQKGSGHRGGVGHEFFGCASSQDGAAVFAASRA